MIVTNPTRPYIAVTPNANNGATTDNAIRHPVIVVMSIVINATFVSASSRPSILLSTLTNINIGTAIANNAPTPNIANNANVPINVNGTRAIAIVLANIPRAIALGMAFSTLFILFNTSTNASNGTAIVNSATTPNMAFKARLPTTDNGIKATDNAIVNMLKAITLGITFSTLFILFNTSTNASNGTAIANKATILTRACLILPLALLNTSRAALSDIINNDNALAGPISSS